MRTIIACMSFMLQCNSHKVISTVAIQELCQPSNICTVPQLHKVVLMAKIFNLISKSLRKRVQNARYAGCV